MTGIERLRELAQKHRIIEHYLTADTIDSIADQIERETQPKRDSAADVSMNAYDLLPQEDREAIAWVREHGGVEKIIKQRRDSVPRAAFERKLGKRLRHIAECEEALRRRNATISALEKTADLLRKQIAEMRPRLMPEDMEWPRFEDGEPVRIGDEFEASCGIRGAVDAVIVYGDGFELRSDGYKYEYDYGERVKRPAKVLDADGVEIRVGDTVYHVGMSTFDPEYNELTVTDIRTKPGLTPIETKNSHNGYLYGKPEDFTHRAPVLAADGLPLREGETVWYLDHVDPLEVRSVSTTSSCGSYVNAYNDYEGEVSAPARCFSHKRHDSWERWNEDAELSPSSYCDKYRIGRVGYEELGMNRDLVRRAKALAGDA